MPSVRLSGYDQRTATPEGGVDSGVRATDATANALEGLGQATEQAATEFQQIQNTTAAKRADTQYATQVNSLLYDPQNGFMYKRGEDALNALPDVQKAMAKARQDVGGSLKNPVQQRMFGEQADVRDAALSGDLQNHAGTQFKVYQDATSDARIDSATELLAGSQDPTSPAGQLAIAQIHQEALAKAGRAGLSGDAAAWYLQQAHSKAVVQMIDAGLDKTADGPFRAGALLDKYGGSILPTERAQLQGKVNQAQTAVAAIPIAQAAVAGALPKEAAPVPGKATDWSDPASTIAGVIGGPVTITSGARSAAKNAAVGGSPTSSHLTNQAVDFAPPEGMSTADAAKKLAASGASFDQVIDEGDHVHVGWGAQMRGQVLTKQGDAYIPTGATVQRAATQAQGAATVAQVAGQSGLVSLEDARSQAASYANSHFPNNPHMASMIDTQVITEWRRQNSEAREGQRDAWQQINTVALAGGNVNDVPADVWSKLLPTQQKAAQKLLAQGGYAKESDPHTLGGVFDLAASNPAAFASADLVKIAPDLSKGDFDSLMHMQLAARQGDGAWKKPNEGVAQVDRAAILTIPPTIAKDKAKTQAFKGALFSAASAATAANGNKPLTDEQVVDLGHKLAMDQVTGHGIFGDKTAPLYQMDYDAIAKADPQGESRVFRYLQQKNGGKVPSRGDVANTYRTLKANGRL